jgi:molybdopterin-biosynthesis enzyme MoeA-like protein
MARIPGGATLIDNPVSSAPGIKIDNVYVLAGVPNIMQAMLDGVVLTLRHGPSIKSASVSAMVAESVVAEELGEIARRHPQLDIGSYPWVRQGKFGTALVVRGTDVEAIKQAAEEIALLVKSKGCEPILSAE